MNTTPLFLVAWAAALGQSIEAFSLTWLLVTVALTLILLADISVRGQALKDAQGPARSKAGQG